MCMRTVRRCTAFLPDRLENLDPRQTRLGNAMRACFLQQRDKLRIGKERLTLVMPQQLH